MVSTNQLYQRLVNDILQVYEENEARELVKMLLEDGLGISFEQVLVDDQVDLSITTEEKLKKQMALLKQYYPIQYVLGKAHFFGRDFKVNEHVLIPRQETEELVNEIIIDNKKEGLKILDIGAGSGCIGITLGLELSNSIVTLLEVDANALDVAIENSKNYGLQVDYILADVLELDHLPDKYDLIVSNPPYVTEGEKEHMLNNVLKHEPAKALFVPDQDPLLFYRNIIYLAKDHLVDQGKLYFEINENFGAELVGLCEKENCSYVQLIKDLNGRDRIIKAMF